MAYSPSTSPQPLSADLPHTREISTLYSILPSVVQSRLPQLPSIRRSASMYGLPTHPRTTTSTPSSGTRTPDTEQKKALAITGQEEDIEGYTVESASVSSEDDGRSNVGVNFGGRRRRPETISSENRTGIEWKFANQGFNLLDLALEESSTLPQGPLSPLPSFPRQLYIHSLTYLLRGLPQDLTPSEQLSIRSSLPPTIVEPLHFEVGPLQRTQLATPSLLHRVLASSIVQLFVFLQFILPYVRLFLNVAHTYDQEHKISEKLVAQGIGTIDKLGRGSMTFGGAVLGFSNGRAGQVMGEAAKWLVEGVVGGVNEGLEEGMGIFRGEGNGSSGKVNLERSIM